ncbi:MAG: LysR family transcriptional regulator [Sandaracinaceae bacterium]
MERATRLRSLWSWLPDFRAVAETEHLPSASKALHVSASSLSRTIRLLEEDVGQPLFDRIGRGLVLNAAGRELLGAVRNAMRGVDEALSRIGPGQFVGEVTISVAGPFAPVFVLPALGPLRDAHPELCPRIVSVADDRVSLALTRGELDVAILDAPAAREGLSIRELGRVPHGLFCGAGHPLHGRANVTVEDIAPHPFVTPPPDPDGGSVDRWPLDWPRKVGLVVHQMQVGVDACASGSYLAVLPAPIGARAGLYDLGVPGIDGAPMFAVHRETLGDEGRVEAVLAAIGAVAPPR